MSSNQRLALCIYEKERNFVLTFIQILFENAKVVILVNLWRKKSWEFTFTKLFVSKKKREIFRKCKCANFRDNF